MPRPADRVHVGARDRAGTGLERRAAGARPAAPASTLATGGTLAAGRSGIIDTNFQYTTPALRAYDNFVAAVPDAFPPVVYSGQSIQFRHDAALRTNSGGTLYGGPHSYRGGKFMVPPGLSRVGVAASPR
jgi:hypothetical protein